MTKTTVGGSEQLVVHMRDLERENKALDARVSELQQQLGRLEASARPLNVRLAQTARP